MDIYDFSLKGANVKIQNNTADNVIKANKCNQCNYASSRAGHLRRHLKTHSGDKSQTNATNVTLPLLEKTL